MQNMKGISSSRFESIRFQNAKDGKTVPVKNGLFLQRRQNRLFYLIHIRRRLKAGDNLTFTIDQEFGEIPLDIGLVPKLLIVHLGKFGKGGDLQSLAETFKRFFTRQIHIERIGIVSVDVDLLELREFRSEFHGAEFVDFLLASRRLVGKLIAGEVQNFQSLFLHLLVHGF